MALFTGYVLEGGRVGTEISSRHGSQSQGNYSRTGREEDEDGEAVGMERREECQR